MIRVLHIVHALTRSGGLSNFIMNYYRVIDRTKIQFDFIYFKDVTNNFIDEINQLGGHCYKMSEPSFNMRFFKERNLFFKTHFGEYSVLHCHALFAVAFFSDIARSSGVKKIIAHSHNTTYGTGLFRIIRNKYFVHCANSRSDIHIACSKKASLFMFGKNEFESGKVIIITNAINFNKYKYNNEIRTRTRQSLNIDNKFVVGHVGGFSLLKNHTFLIDIFKVIVDKNPNAVLLLIGGNGIATKSTKKDIQIKIEKLRLSNNVKFLGIKNNINEFLIAMDVMIFPSLFEGLPISLVEAQASGLPVFASDTISNDVKFNNNMYFMSLAQSAETWAENILKINYANIDRTVDFKLKYLFDTNYNVNKLEAIYTNNYEY